MPTDQDELQYGPFHSCGLPREYVTCPGCGDAYDEPVRDVCTECEECVNCCRCESPSMVAGDEMIRIFMEEGG